MAAKCNGKPSNTLTFVLRINPVQQHFLNLKTLQLFADQKFQNQFKRHFEKPVTHVAKKQITVVHIWACCAQPIVITGRTVQLL